MLNLSHISKNNKRSTVFEEKKWNYLGYDRQINSRCLGQYRPLFCRPTNFVSVGPNNIFFCFGGRFLLLNQSLNSPSSNHWSSFNHRQFVMSVVGRATFWHLKLSYMSAGRNRLTTEIRPRVDWSVGRFWQIGWWTTDNIRITLNIYRLSVDKWRSGGWHHASDFFRRLVCQAILTNRLMNNRPYSDYIKHLQSIGW